MICQVVQLGYAYEAMWKHAEHLLGRHGRRENHQGGLQREGIFGVEP